MSLEFALKCAENAIHFSKENQDKIRNAAILISAYISLELNEYNNAKEFSKALFSQNSTADSSSRFTARVYAAQAHCLMHDANSAIDCLNPLLLEVSIGTAMFPEATQMFNLTYEQIYLLNPTLDKKKNSKMTEKDAESPEFVITQAYVDIKNGKPASGLRILNEYTQEEE